VKLVGHEHEVPELEKAVAARAGGRVDAEKSYLIESRLSPVARREGFGSVADMLKEKGLKARELTVESHGERNPLVKTPDNTQEPKNRRVEVSVR